MKLESGKWGFTDEREIFKYNEIIMRDIIVKLEIINNELRI